MSEWQDDLEDLRHSIRRLDEGDEALDVELMLATILRTSQHLHESEARFRLFIEESSDGIWSASFGDGVPVDLPVQRQVELMHQFSFIDYCNPAMARMYGFESYREMIRHPKDRLMPPSDPRNLDYLRRFIESSYRVTNALTYERHRDGRELVLSNSVVGRVEDGCLVRAWGVQRLSKPVAQSVPIHTSALICAIRARLGPLLNDPRLPPTVREDLSAVVDACRDDAHGKPHRH